jgi:2,3-bisphosphoglycerate-dependent phosphoglycerate mutase
MELTLIRHGQSVNNAQGDEQRHHDPELTPLGHAQAKKLAEYLLEGENTEDTVRLPSDDPTRLDHHAYGFDRIYVSAMHRALQTASPVAKALKAEVHIWPELHESGGIYMHTPEGVVAYGGLTRAQIVESFPEFVPHDLITEAGWYNVSLGEEDIFGCYARAMRVAKTLRQLAEADETKDMRIALVTHGNFISALLNALYNNLPSQNLYFWHYNTAFTRVDFVANGWMIVRYANRIAHLPPAWVT